MEYLSNFFIRRQPEEIVVDAPKEEPAAKLPWDPDEYVRFPFYARDEYARTHFHEAAEPELQRQMAPYPVYRKVELNKPPAPSNGGKQLLN
jgi:hypothetical protein